jgi:serine/threonine-protein kinase
MANVTLDGAGRLLQMIVVPPPAEREAATAKVDWQPFLTAAGFDTHQLRPATAEWSAPVDTDTKTAWIAKNGARIEAAQYHGRPAWFSLMPRPPAQPPGVPLQNALAERLAFTMFVMFMITIPLAALLLARSNVRQRRGDRAGAVRAGIIFFVASLVSLIFAAHHPMSFVDEWIIGSWHISQATFWGLMTGVMYLALEPLVRRRWPQMLISWTRLLASRWRDPMVGRDVLLGAAAATIAVGLWHTTMVVSQSATLGPSSTMGPARHVVSMLSYTLSEALLRGLGLVVLLVVMRIVVRNDIIASLLTAFLIALMTLGDAAGPIGLRAFYGGLAAWVGVIVARQLGLLAAMSYAFFVLIQQRVPLTLDSDAWYFDRSAVVMVLLITIIAFAFRISVGSRRLLPNLTQ